MNKKVLLGMSGGVDSSVSAKLLMDAGYEVVGITMKLHNNSACGGADRAREAKALCDTLGIQHYTVDFMDEFKTRVIDDFIRCYANCQTPNPCVECNKYLKFGVMYDYAKQLGCDYISTGHYAKVEYSEKYGQYVLKKAMAKAKDQSYFLYNLTPEILQHFLLPLSSYQSKDEVRSIAADNGMAVATKPDSEDVCFIPDGDYKKFLEENSDIRPLAGDITLADGTVLGRHSGLYRHTIGQRKGLGIAYKAPLYVTGFDVANNRLIVGEENELYTQEFTVKNLHWTLANAPTGPVKAMVKIRFSRREYPATILHTGDTAQVIFDRPQKSVTPGQSAVFYDGDIVLGGGKIV